jgi:hypothetical protein
MVDYHVGWRGCADAGSETARRCVRSNLKRMIRSHYCPGCRTQWKEWREVVQWEYSTLQQGYKRRRAVELKALRQNR